MCVVHTFYAEILCETDQTLAPIQLVDLLANDNQQMKSSDPACPGVVEVCTLKDYLIA